MSGADAEILRLEPRAELKSFLGLSLKNGLLNLVTLTLYRFWGRTEVRRRLWAATYLNDQPFEYTGRGKELFIGFLIVVVGVLMPLLAIIFAAQFFAPQHAAAIIFPIYLLMGFLAGLGQFTAFRYLASRTSRCGVAFRLQGSPARYGLQVLGYGLLSIVTLGWFWPAAQRRLAAPLWGGLSFGDRRFTFDLDEARKSKVYGAYALGWVGALVVYIVSITLMVALLVPHVSGGAPPVPTLAMMMTIYFVTAIMVLGLGLAFAPYHAAALRTVAAGIGFEGARFRLNVHAPALAWLWISNIVLIIGSLGFLMPFVEARVSKFLLSRVEATGEVDLGAVRQVAAPKPSVGEGLADALGMATV